MEEKGLKKNELSIVKSSRENRGKGRESVREKGSDERFLAWESNEEKSRREKNGGESAETEDQ